MSSDLVERLRRISGGSSVVDLARDAAAEIVRLRALTAEQATVHDAWLTERDLADQLASHLEWALRCVGSLPLEMRTTFDARMAEVLAAHTEARRER